jgi:DNA-binding NarL/FixJ family response regulator
LKILIAEDEVLPAMELELALAELGCATVGPVDNVDDIVPTALRASVDAALLDINMKGEYSYAAAYQLLAAGIAVLFVTGYDQPPDLPGPLESIPRLQKPFTAYQLAAAISETFSDRAR